MKSLIAAVLLSVGLTALAAEPIKASKDAVTKEACVKKDKKGNCVEKAQVPQPKKNPVEEKKKKDAEKAAAKAAAAKK